MPRFRRSRDGDSPAEASRKRAWLRRLLGGVLALWLGVAAVHSKKPLPQGVSYEGAFRPIGDLEFLFDLTSGPVDGGTVEQQIFDRIFSMISEAREFVVVDMFLFNGTTGGTAAFRDLSGELTDSLVAWMGREGAGRAIFITDEINSFYGADSSPEIRRLEEAGVEVVITRLSRLRDSNPAFSGLWRVALQWFGTSGPGWLPNFLTNSGQKVPARAYLKLLNFKANHRKLIVTDTECLVASANPHDGSARHSNIAFAGSGPLCGDILVAERAVAAFSGESLENWPVYLAARPPGSEEEGRPNGSGLGAVRLVTEGAILDAILDAVERAGPGDSVDLAMFYLSHREVVNALVDAAARGAVVRLVLDPNKDAFGREKGGIPNRQVAHELVEGSEGGIQVRWYDTHGEQFHTKLVRVSGPESTEIVGGSANLTRRNVGDFNLEADLHLSLPADSPLALATGEYFEQIFGNRHGAYTLPYEAYEDRSFLKRLRYRIEEFTGFCSY